VVFRADRGVGRSVASALMDAGWDSILVGQDEAALEVLALRAHLGAATADVVICDLDDRASADAAFEAIRERAPSLDGVVVMADRTEETGLDEPDTRSFDVHLEANLASTFRAFRGMSPLLREGGRMVAVATQLARAGGTGLHGACASQAAVVGMIRALGLEFAPKEITVNAVLAATGETPIGRAPRAEEVAAAVVFLIGPDAGAITGQALNVCGGATA